MKVYTKTGDNGTTSLVGGERVFKTDARVEAYGTVDELSAFIALLGDETAAAGGAECYGDDLARILSALMTVEALLATGEGGAGKVAPLGDAAVEYLETRIDAMQAKVPAITRFTIPGGNRCVSLCHVCRTVCRRAERRAIAADAEHGVDATVMRYLNRLSDYFYLLGRALTVDFDVAEREWIP